MVPIDGAGQLCQWNPVGLQMILRGFFLATAPFTSSLACKNKNRKSLDFPWSMVKTPHFLHRVSSFYWELWVCEYDQKPPTNSRAVWSNLRGWVRVQVKQIPTLITSSSSEGLWTAWKLTTIGRKHNYPRDSQWMFVSSPFSWKVFFIETWWYHFQ